METVYVLLLCLTAVGSKPSPELDPEPVIEFEDMTIPPPPPTVCFSFPIPARAPIPDRCVLPPKSERSPAESSTTLGMLVLVSDKVEAEAALEDAGR